MSTGRTAGSGDGRARDLAETRPAAAVHRDAGVRDGSPAPGGGAHGNGVVRHSAASGGAAVGGGAETGVREALRLYFDGLYYGDIALLDKVFHPQAIYATATEGSLLRLTMAEYFPIVAAREAPATRGDERHDRILSVESAGPVTALARVECALGPKRFTDLLTFVQVDGRWRIIAKVFHYDLVEN
ncbi:nuclear transport factor 2 family protein [Nocardia sp. CC227C]|uniref:nuclear transport factor 2 family protein n=1 Tax=Nocardia sp. CC227C TaxID=3044562 RepID=UPI00278C7F49|nr:nuclear transport factor 2 family protein [Nocardia sp. CC227C]